MRSRYNELNDRISLINSGLGGEIEDIKRRLKKLECPHDQSEFVKPYGNIYERRCRLCGVVLETYDSEEEMLRAKKKYLEEKCLEWKEEIDGSLSNIS